ncbi:MAG: hypothetical protein IT366_24430 [Candidatus Hydrogenedentes bacterium]|nr:hypothetical protein [Candidatus Hydrogenedentota bacterium]
MFDPKSPFNGAHLSELSTDPADHDHLNAWLAHLHGYKNIQRGPYQSTHGMNHDGWSAQHPKQARRVAIPDYCADYNQLMPLLFETHARLLAGGCIQDMGPDEKNRWQVNWFDGTDPNVEPGSKADYVLISVAHFELPVAIAAAIITALEGQATATANITDFARPAETSNHKSQTQGS